MRNKQVRADLIKEEMKVMGDKGHLYSTSKDDLANLRKLAALCKELNINTGDPIQLALVGVLENVERLVKLVQDGIKDDGVGKVRERVVDARVYLMLGWEFILEKLDGSETDGRKRAKGRSKKARKEGGHYRA